MDLEGRFKIVIATGDGGLHDTGFWEPFCKGIEKNLQPLEKVFRSYDENKVKAYYKNTLKPSHDKALKRLPDLYVYYDIERKINEYEMKVESLYLLSIILSQIDLPLLEELKKGNLIYLKKALGEHCRIHKVDKSQRLDYSTFGRNVKPKLQPIKEMFEEKYFKLSMGI